MTKIGVMICGHGSRSQSAVDEFATLAQQLPAFLPGDWLTDYGYLEFANPVLRDGLDRLRDAGCDRILAVPGMLFAAMHAKNDIPTVLNTYAARHGIDVSYGRELGVDPKMIAAASAVLGPDLLVWGPEALWLVLAVAAMPGLGAYWIYGWAQRIVGASRVAVALYLGPLYASIGAWWMLGEPPGWHHLVGAMLILPGVFLVTAARGR